MSQPADEHGAVSPGDDRPDEVSQPSDFAVARSLKRELLDELRAGWRQGRPVRAEDLLPRWPGDPGRDPDVASVLFEEFCQRRQQSVAAGEPPDLEEYGERFPALKDSLASLMRLHQVVRSVAGGSGGSGLGLSLPAVGDQLFGFRLRQELGRGAFARVFLAEQAALAGRPVVVKVSAIEGEEPQTLAQLQHTHIVPIHSVHEDARAGIRAVCMPYFGGASLSRVLQALWSEDRSPTRGQELVQALAAVGGPPAGKIEERGSRIEDRGSPSSILELLSGQSYVQAAVWIVARLAEGLQHAHERGVLHCDVKPSNVLLGADGQPMLLDFNLAQQLHGDQCRAQATLGGTVAYMAPEHLRALATRDPALARRVDRRTDVYALGMVLFEMLTGRRPFDQSASYSPMPALIEAMAVERSRSVPSLRGQRPDLPWGLESIARKCLAPDPAHRYQRAEHLAEDLRRFLNDEPLRHAPELSWRERGGKWLRRHPRLAAAALVGGVAALLLTAAVVVVRGARAELQATQEEARRTRESQARRLRAANVRAEAARDAQARQRRQEFEAGTVRALCLVHTATDERDHAAQGRKTCERTLALYGILERSDWQRHPDWRRLPAGAQQRLAEDVRELLLVLARARVRTTLEGPGGLAALPAPVAPTPQPLAALGAWAAGRAIWAEGRRRALQQALALLDRAEAVRGLSPSAALWSDRALYLQGLGNQAGARAAQRRARALPPVSARDHYLLALTHSGARRYAEAVAELNRALEKNPRHYWSWFQRAFCHQERGELDLALGDYSVCVGLWPDFSWGYFNRGQVLHHLGKLDAARADYSAALRRDPGLAAAYQNRGLVHLDLGQPGPALADFDDAAARGLDGVVVHGGRGIALENLGRHRAADAAFRRAWARDAGNVPMLLGHGFAVSERLPEQAQASFIKVLRRQPRNARALYGRGLLFSNQARGSEQALFFFTQALEADPTFVAARRARALVLAHRGEGPTARQDAEWCVATDPAGMTLYAAACVYALTAGQATDPTQARWMADRAVAFLREAVAQGYGKDRAAGDTDLKAVWRHPQFRQVVNGAGGQ
jgi:serine/threonine protein kinase/tetratricopeptide (TPR) repeat protein